MQIDHEPTVSSDRHAPGGDLFIHSFGGHVPDGGQILDEPLALAFTQDAQLDFVDVFSSHAGQPGVLLSGSFNRHPVAAEDLRERFGPLITNDENIAAGHSNLYPRP